jgi:hypothetical protein
MAVVPVKIRRDPENRKRCIIDPPHFRANLQDAIRFLPGPGLPIVKITFREDGVLPDGSKVTGLPFAENPVNSGQPPHAFSTEGKFAFDVSWEEPDGVDGSGNGTGEVPPG